MCFYGRIWPYYEPAVGLIHQPLVVDDCSLPVWRQVQILTCDDLVVIEKILSLTLRSYFYKIRNMLLVIGVLKLY